MQGRRRCFTKNYVQGGVMQSSRKEARKEASSVSGGSALAVAAAELGPSAAAAGRRRRCSESCGSVGARWCSGGGALARAQCPVLWRWRQYTMARRDGSSGVVHTVLHCNYSSSSVRVAAAVIVLEPSTVTAVDCQ